MSPHPIRTRVFRAWTRSSRPPRLPKAAPVFRQGNSGSRHLPLTCFSTKLQHQLVQLNYSCCSNGVPLGDQTARCVDRTCDRRVGSRRPRPVAHPRPARRSRGSPIAAARRSCRRRAPRLRPLRPNRSMLPRKLFARQRDRRADQNGFRKIEQRATIFFAVRRLDSFDPTDAAQTAPGCDEQQISDLDLFMICTLLS